MDTVVDFIISEEPFKLMPLEKAPRAAQNTALLLYRERMGMEQGMVILPEQSVLSSSIRMGKYDRKIVVDISRHQMEMDMKIRTQERYCDFLVHIDIEYGISDVKYAASNNLSHIQDTIQEAVRKFMNTYQESFSIYNEIRLERETDTLTKTLVEKFMFLYINARTKIQLDEAGQRVRDSDIKTRTDGIIQQNEAKIQKLNTQRAGELERIEYQEKKKILEEKNKLDEAKLEKLQGLMKRYGDDALLVNAYLDEEMSSLDFNEQMRKQKQEQEDRIYAKFRQFYDMDIMSDEFINSYAGQVLFGKPKGTIEVGETKKEKLEQKDEVEIEDGEEIGNYMGDIE